MPAVPSALCKCICVRGTRQLLSPPSSCNWMPTEVVIANPSQAGQTHLSLFIIRARILIITKPLNIFREEEENQINKG